MVIYKITNKINGKIYIGQTINFKNRIIQHWCDARRRKRKCPLHNAIAKYGQDNFIVEIIHECENKQHMSEMEIKYIEELNSLHPNGYNMTKGGEFGTQRVITEEYRKACSERTKGSKNPRYGNPQSEETKRKISEHKKGKPTGRQPMLGKKHTEETKRKISEASKGHSYNLGVKRDYKFKQACRERITLRNQKKIINTETKEIINSVKELALKLEMKYSTLVNMLNGTNPNKTKWIYLSSLS